MIVISNLSICVCIDDMTIKLWDWDAKWALKQTFEGHIHYVMQIAINPKDNNTFASASLDRTVKVKDNSMNFLSVFLLIIRYGN
jgi:WD40 repeat protein